MQNPTLEDYLRQMQTPNGKFGSNVAVKDVEDATANGHTGSAMAAGGQMAPQLGPWVGVAGQAGMQPPPSYAPDDEGYAGHVGIDSAPTVPVSPKSAASEAPALPANIPVAPATPSVSDSVKAPAAAAPQASGPSLDPGFGTMRINQGGNSQQVIFAGANQASIGGGKSPEQLSREYTTFLNGLPRPNLFVGNNPELRLSGQESQMQQAILQNHQQEALKAFLGMQQNDVAQQNSTLDQTERPKDRTLREHAQDTADAEAINRMQQSKLSAQVKAQAIKDGKSIKEANTQGALVEEGEPPSPPINRPYAPRGNIPVLGPQASPAATAPQENIPVTGPQAAPPGNIQVTSSGGGTGAAARAGTDPYLGKLGSEAYQAGMAVDPAKVGVGKLMLALHSQLKDEGFAAKLPDILDYVRSRGVGDKELSAWINPGRGYQFMQRMGNMFVNPSDEEVLASKIRNHLGITGNNANQHENQAGRFRSGVDRLKSLKGYLGMGD